MRNPLPAPTNVRKSVLVLLGYILGALTCICVPFGASAADTRASASAKATGRVFRVGAIIPLTGSLASYGDSVKRGFELAREDHPDSFTNVEFVYQDSAYDGKTALSALQSLTSRGDIDLYYTWGVSPNEALLPVTNARKLPVIAETSLKSAVVGKPLTIRAAPTGDMTAQVLSRELIKRGTTSVGILLADIPYYRDIVDSLTSYLTNSGVRVEIVDTFTPEASDFKSTIVKIRPKRYDAIGVFLLPDQIVTYYRQTSSLHFLLQSFGASIHDSQELMNRAGAGAENTILVGYDVNPDFRARWLRAYKDDSRVGCGANAYDTALMIAELFGTESNSRLTAEETIARFSSIKARRGASGAFGFGESDDGGKHFDFPLSARIIKHGQIEALQ